MEEEPYRDPVIEVYKQHVDRSLLRENLKLTVEQRLDKHRSVLEFIAEMKEAGRKARRLQQENEL